MLDLYNEILLVEDDQSLGFVIKDNLRERGFNVNWCKDGQEGFEAVYQGSFHLCILDVMLPKKDGFTLAKEIRQLNDHLPIIFLTAKSQELDRLEGFKKGGDDYLTKPFVMEELVSRIEAVTKRAYRNFKKHQIKSRENFEIGDCSFQYKSLILTTPEKEIQLTSKEGDLLRMLCLHENRVLERSLALKLIWGKDDYFLGRSMDVFITRLRKYLKDDPKVSIDNIQGVGFQLSTKAS